MNVFDILIIVLTLILVVTGSIKGLGSSILSVFSGTINILLAALLTGPLKSLFKAFGLTNAIKSAYIAKMSTMSGFGVNLVGLNSSELNSFITTSINNSKFSGFIKLLTKWFCKVTPEQIADKEFITLSDILSNAYSNFWITLFSFIISFALIYLVIFIISRIIKKARTNHSFYKADNFLGFIFGLARSFVCIAIIIGVVSLLKEDGIMSWLVSYVKSSVIGGWAYSFINPFVDNYINFENIIALAKSL